MSSLAEAIGPLLGRLTRLEGPALAAVSRLIVVAGALVTAFVAYRAAGRLVDRLLTPLERAPDPSRVQRARTLGPLMKSVARYGLAFLVFVMLLHELGVDIQALLLSASVLGLAVGLGAQSLIKDVINGFFILFEDLVGVGDVIEVGGQAGQVEAIGLRVTKLRMLNGALRVVPNGELTQFLNYNKGWARAVVDVSVADDTEVRRALQVLDGVGAAWARETKEALEPPQAQGILGFAEGQMTLRLLVKVPASRRFDVELELRRRIKEAFEREGIPFARRVVYLQERPS
jgi:small conductance mechanosensitive channel